MEWETATDLARRVSNGDAAVWAEFCEAVHPALERWANDLHFLRALRNADEHRRDVLTKTLEKLQQDDYRRLASFFEKNADHPELARYFGNWLKTVTGRVGIDHLRGVPEYRRQEEAGESNKRLVSVVTMNSQRNAVHQDRHTLEIMANELLAHLDAIPDRYADVLERWRSGRLPDDEPEARALLEKAQERERYRPAIELWSRGHSYDEISDLLDLSDAEHAHRIVRAAKAVLRRQFAEPVQ